VFTNNFWRELFLLLDTKLLLSLAYHAQTDGLTERVNQCLESYLRCAVSATPKQWLKWLPLVDLWYNSCYHTSLKFSPFKAIYGTEPSIGSISTIANSEDTAIRATLIETQNFLELLKRTWLELSTKWIYLQTLIEVIDPFRWEKCYSSIPMLRAQWSTDLVPS
jgi:hypothetical protein